jgi:hypothetical protein
MSLNDLPGAEIILPGLSDLHNGNSNTIGALLIAIAATRLTEAGLDIQNYHLAPDPELTLYARLQNEREDAYPHYNALLNRLNSFCSALEMTLSIDTGNSRFCQSWDNSIASSSRT